MTKGPRENDLPKKSSFAPRKNVLSRSQRRHLFSPQRPTRSSRNEEIGGRSPLLQRRGASARGFVGDETAELAFARALS